MISPAFAVRSVVERNVISYRSQWAVLVAGLFEPLIWLLGIGVGLGGLIDKVDVDGVPVEYAAFITPGLVAVAAMNGSAFDATYNFYYKLKYARTFDAMVATPLTMSTIVMGEISWAMVRATLYASTFVVIAAVFGLLSSWWAILIVPSALLIGLSVAALGILSTTYMRNWHDFDYLGLVLQLLFLCSATFFPLSVYPGWAQWVVRATPLYHGVALCRDLAIGTVGMDDLAHIAYLVGLAVVCAHFARGRLTDRLLS